MPHDHPCFPGHFPGQPLLPGALILAEVREAIARVPALVARLGAEPALAAAKFLAPVGPGASLEIELQPEAGAAGGVRFEVRSGGVVAARGRGPRPGARAGAAPRSSCRPAPTRPRPPRPTGPTRPSAATCWYCASSAGWP